MLQDCEERRSQGNCDPSDAAHTCAMLSGFDHVALTCRDVLVSAKWYREALGMREEASGAPGGNPVCLSIGTAKLALFQAGTRRSVVSRPPALRVDHFAFLAATYDSFEAVRSRLATCGVPAEFQGHELSHSIYIHDPDGHVVEITTYDLPRL